MSPVNMENMTPEEEAMAKDIREQIATLRPLEQDIIDDLSKHMKEEGGLDPDIVLSAITYTFLELHNQRQVLMKILMDKMVKDGKAIKIEGIMDPNKNGVH